MNHPGSESEQVARRLRRTLAQNGETSRGLTGSAVRNAASRAARGTLSAGRGARSLAREAVEGAVQAVGEIGGETRAFLKDSVVGTLEGTAQVVTITAPAVTEVVLGAVRRSSRVGAGVGEAGREAVEGAIVGAVSVGVDSVDAAAAAVDGAVQATVEVGGDLREVAGGSIGGVVSGVAATGGNVAAATRDAAYTLIAHEHVADQEVARVAGVAEVAVDAALVEAERADIDTEEVISAAAVGAVEAAYEVSRSHGDSVRSSVVRRLLETRVAVSPELELRLSEVAHRLSDELPRGRAAWRGVSLGRAVRVLLNAGGIDLAASLAFFMLLSLLPLVALVIMGIAVFGNPEAIGQSLTEILTYYFPTSVELIEEAVENLLNGSLAIGILALASLVLGANGLFMATNRAVNRVFGMEARSVIQTTVAEVSIATLIVLLFLLGIGLTAFLQVAVSFGEGIAETTGIVTSVGLLATGLFVSEILPAISTAMIFAFVYARIPRSHVEWRDATFGAIVAIVLFEVGKHLFFWFTGLAGQRNVVYGPIASVVVLMMWAYMAGLIFLYGAAVTRVAGELRPSIRAAPQTKGLKPKET